jgi:hypoxanthine phosphoribosyltransferase
MLIKDKKFRPFITRQQLAARIAELGSQLNADYEGKKPLFITVLNGAFMFAADLMREVQIASEISFIKFTSYQSMHSTGKVDQVIGIQEDLRDRHVIILEDIVDTGITMSDIYNEVKQFQPASVETVSLLLKPASLQKPVRIKYVGFEIESRFVVGYGLDYDGHGRNLHDIYVLDEGESEN